MKIRKWNKNRILALLLAVICFFGLLPAAPEPVAAAWPTDIEIDAPSAIVMEVNTGAILYEKNSHERNYPASITKILTTMMALETCELDEIVTFSHDAVFKNEGDTSHIARDEGEKMTMEQTLYAVMLESANECAWAVAEHVAKKSGGGEPEFVELMNQRVAELGCTDTHFSNPNGLPDEEHYTSAYDMALIGCAAYKNETFRTITGKKQYVIPPTNRHKDSTYLNNHHKLLHAYKGGEYVNEYCTGGKTGYTTVAHHTLVTYAEKDGMALCIVVMREEDPSQLVDTNRLIDYCFNSFSLQNVTEEDLARLNLEEKSLGLLNPNKRFVALDASSTLVLPKDVPVSEAQCSVSAMGDASSGKIASLEYTYDGHRVGSANIISYPAEAESSIFENVTRKEEEDVILVSPLWIMVWIIVLVLVGLAAILLIRTLRFLKKEKEKLFPYRNMEEKEEAAKLSKAKTTLRKNERKRQQEERRTKREKRKVAREEERIALELAEEEAMNGFDDLDEGPKLKLRDALSLDLDDGDYEDEDESEAMTKDEILDLEEDDEVSVKRAPKESPEQRKARRAQAKAQRAAARAKRHEGDRR